MIDFLNAIESIVVHWCVIKGAQEAIQAIREHPLLPRAWADPHSNTIQRTQITLARARQHTIL